MTDCMPVILIIIYIVKSRETKDRKDLISETKWRNLSSRKKRGSWHLKERVFGISVTLKYHRRIITWVFFLSQREIQWLFSQRKELNWGTEQASPWKKMHVNWEKELLLAPEVSSRSTETSEGLKDSRWTVPSEKSWRWPGHRKEQWQGHQLHIQTHVQSSQYWKRLVSRSEN